MTSKISDSWEIYAPNETKIGAMIGVVDSEQTPVFEGEMTQNQRLMEIQDNIPSLKVSRAVVYKQELEGATDEKHLHDVLNITIKHKFIVDGRPKTAVYLGCYLHAIPKEYMIDDLAVHENLEFLYEQREEYKDDN